MLYALISALLQCLLAIFCLQQNCRTINLAHSIYSKSAGLEEVFLTETHIQGWAWSFITLPITPRQKNLRNKHSVLWGIFLSRFRIHLRHFVYTIIFYQFWGSGFMWIRIDFGRQNPDPSGQGITHKKERYWGNVLRVRCDILQFFVIKSLDPDLHWP